MTGWLWRSMVLCTAWTVLSAIVQAQDADAPTTEVDEASAEELTDARADSPADWSVQLAAEAGVALRNVDLPRDGVTYQIRSGVHPALGVAFRLDYHSSRRFSIGMAARYQSSIGLVLDEQLAGAELHPRKTRSHLFEVGITPSLHWDDSGWAITGMLGYSIAELDPENHLVTPSYHLGGPHARIAVRLPLGTQRVRVSLGPEGQLTLQIGDELLARGVAARGLGAGVNAAFEVSLSERFWIAATYRELHFWLDTQQGSSFTDGLRVVTAQLGGTL
jgi:hypothetical protein